MGPLVASAAALLATDGTCALQFRSSKSFRTAEPPLWSLVDLLPRQAAGSFIAASNSSEHVDVLIGSGGHGHTFPGATTPWGMVQATPWVRKASVDRWDLQSGYSSDAEDPFFHGMAHSALSGAGAGEMGELRLLPVLPDEKRHLILHSQTVDASPGYFAAKVSVGDAADAGSTVQIRSSATPRGAVHEFTFPDRGPHTIKVALSEVLDNYYGWVLGKHRTHVASDRRFEGCMLGHITGIGDAAAHMCFVVEFDQAFASPAQGLDPSEKDVAFTFREGGNSTLTARVAVSRTDLAHARGAFEHEVSGKGFEEVLQEARTSWEKALGALRVKVKSHARKRVFYTALYHSMISPNLLSDADGSYRLQKADPGDLPRRGVAVDFDTLEEKLPLRRSKDGGGVYHTFSAWDTYRGLHPLMNLIHPEVSERFGESLMAFSDAWGYIPAWQLVHSPTDMMEGDGGSIILATMAVNGLVDKQRALEVLREGRMQPVQDKRKCLGLPECMQGRVSELLEQAKADRCVAHVAESLGQGKLVERFTNRSRLAFALWDEKQGVFAPKDSTDAHTLVDLDSSSDLYMEGSPLQYSWSAEFDLPKMVELRKGEEGLACALDQFVYNSKAQTGRIDMSGSFGGISLGNEPTMHVPYLYSLVGYPSRTQELVGQLMDKLFSDKADGLPGNDDLGQMSSWAIFTMLGFYPVDPCSGEYALGRPFIDEAELSLRGSAKLSIKVHDQSDENIYVRRLQWNSQDLDMARPKLSFDMISGGGLLEFWMASETPPGADLKCQTKKEPQRAQP